MVVVARGYQASRISTHAIETALGTEAPLSSALAWAYHMEGHRFYMLHVPTRDMTLVYDVASGLWHERAALTAEGAFSRHRCHVGTYGHGRIMGGDYESGQVYTLSLEAFDDNGAPLVKERVTPWVATRQLRVTHHGLYLLMDTGAGMPSDTLPAREPQVMMQFSDDGRTWSSPEMWSGAGAQGAYTTEVAYYRLGQSRRRIYRIRISDPLRVSLSGADLDLVEDQH